MKKYTCFLLFSALLAAGSVAEDGGGGRIVAVGDVHGSSVGLVTILQRAGLIDAETHWIGGDATLVQTGDLLDRGLDIRQVMDLLMRLQDEAAAAGGRVVVLLGNHEAMNLIGFYRDVNPEVYAEFADDRSEKRRKEGYKNFRKYWQERAAAENAAPPDFNYEVKARWMETYPPGYLEYTEALGPDGVYGRWLRTLPVAVLIDGVLFVHGGIGPELSGLTIEEINRRVSDEIAAYDTVRAYMVEKHLVPETANLNVMLEAYLRQKPDDPEVPPDPVLERIVGSHDWLSQTPEGPLWFRGSARWDEATRGDEMVALLDGIGARHVVSGHTVQGSRNIESRFGGRVFLIDTGMLQSHYKGRPSALVIENGRFIAIYGDGGEMVLYDESAEQEEALADAA